MKIWLTSAPLLFGLGLMAVLVGSAYFARRRAVSMRIPAKTDSIRPLTVLVSEIAERAKLSEDAIFHCRLALDEACMNIIEHAYPDNTTGEIEVLIKAKPGSCSISLTDFGEPYNPAQVADPPVGSTIEESTPGGLGLYLMRRVMDEVSYTPGIRSNRLVMVKRS